MTAQSFIMLIIFLFPLAYSPGPGNMFFALNSARFGVAKTLTSSFGYHVATWIVTFVIGFIYLNGLNAIPQVLMPLKYIGSLYIMYIAYKLFNAGMPNADKEAKPPHFIDGVMLLVLNPKAYIIILLLFTQFLTPSQTTSHLSQMSYLVLLTSIFTVNNFIAFFIWSVLGDVLLKYFRKDSNARTLNRIFGTILFFVAVWIMVS